MPPITNSNRRIYRGTYAPIKIGNSEEEIAKRKQTVSVFEKLSFLRNLKLQKAEIAQLNTRGNSAIARLLSEHDLFSNAALTSKLLKPLSKIDPDNLIAFGTAAKELRVKTKKDFQKALTDIKRSHETFLQTPEPEATNTLTRERIVITKAARPATNAALKWAASMKRPEFTALITQAQPYSAARLAGIDAVDFINDLVLTVDELAEGTDSAIDDFIERMAIEPVGRLHIERLQMYPVSIERGELLYSLPLAPKETVRLSHKEWAIKTEEFEKIVQDSLEDYSEEGVAEKNDISQSTTSQRAHSTATSLSGSYSGWGFSASVGYDSTSDDSQAMTDSRNSSIELTRKASSRVKRDHKVSFKVTSTMGSEEEAVRVITNPSENNTMRLDYFKLMRKWRVDLYRYDIRMTYDIVIPNPGADLRQKIEEVAALDKLIELPFEFDLPLNAITTSNWYQHAVNYGADVDAPPQATLRLQQYKELPEKDLETSSKIDHDSIEFDVLDEYEVDSAWLRASTTKWDDHPDDVMFNVYDDMVEAGDNTYESALRNIEGRSGRIAIIYRWQYARTGMVRTELNTIPKQTTLDRWRFKVWDMLRRTANETFLLQRQSFRDRRTKLLEEIQSFDALTLRQMEREAIMKGILKWIFGPGFDLMPANILSLFQNSSVTNEDLIDPGNLHVDEWQRVLEYGEFIKFLHQAIEWENVLYFLYPYFWDSPQNWATKQFLQHPDMFHRTFLRAGSARVVLTIRRGFEQSFTSLLQTGSFGELPNDHPYVTIAEEIENYANTNYPGIPPANPADEEADAAVENAEQGILIGQWFEYTPTSAIDISMNSNLNDIA